jgi:hypothetical protein
MHPKQLALVEGALDAIGAECLRSPVATLNAGHLKALLVERLLRDGAAVLERGASAREGKLLRLAGEVVKVERHAIARPPRAGRAPRTADLRVLDPIALSLELHARSALAGTDRTLARALGDRMDAVAAGTSDVMLLACERRAWDALRVERPGADGEPPALARMCAALLPPSAELSDERARREPTLGGRAWRVLAAITPMVYGAQRVVAALWPARRPPPPDGAPAQLDVFED